MAIRYPNGRRYVAHKHEKEVKVNKKHSYSNRGMTLEADLNETNAYYLERGLAVIHKKPTPVQIVQVDYPTRSAAIIKEAYFKQASTTDYNGVYRGRYIDFEAKETKNKTSFPLRNFHDHQIEHMKQVLAHDGITFAILCFTQLQEIYLLDAEHLIQLYEQQKKSRKSIKKTMIEDVGHRIQLAFHPRIDYLKTVDSIYFPEEQ